VTTPPNVESDLGWALGTVTRSYLRTAAEAVADVPGGPRGYQVLSTAACGEASSQLAMAQRLGVDRTVMTYLLDDLEMAGLVERKPDPADRRARRARQRNHVTDALHALIWASDLSTQEHDKAEERTQDLQERLDALYADEEDRIEDRAVGSVIAGLACNPRHAPTCRG